MIIAATGALCAEENDPILYRGEFCEILPRIREDGYEAVELHIADSGAIDKQLLWRLLRDNGLGLTSIGTGSIRRTKRISLTDSSAAVRREAIAHFEHHMEVLSPFHGVVIAGLIIGRYANCGGPEEFHANLTESLRRLNELAGQHDVYVGIELMNRFEADCLKTIAEGVKYIRDNRFSRIVLHVDTAHMNMEERDIGRAILAGRGAIGHVHIADNDRWYPGHAHYDFRQTLQALKDIGYDGALALEIRPFPSAQAASERSIQYLKSILASLE